MSLPAPPDPGWRKFPVEERLLNWLDSVRDVAEAAIEAPENQQWLRHGKTWFAGVDALLNDAEGRVAGGPALACAALDAAGPLPLHPAQVSVNWPGYPQQDPDESDAAHRYRVSRDAAHLDGLLPIGPDRRRHLHEPHAWILGLPLTPMQAGNAPLVVWEGSHLILRDAVAEALGSHAPETWPDIDLTEPYQAARRHCFETCTRRLIEAEPGEAILLHRAVLHGVAPWTGPNGPPRVVIYFRPILPGGISDWLSLA